MPDESPKYPNSTLYISNDALKGQDEERLCTVCKQHKPIYTCPQCSLKTCSLQCVTAHKQAFSCSGIRDRTAYVPMNQYGLGKMMDDYTYLEDVGRQIEGWGREIAQQGLMNQPTAQTRGAMRGRGRGRGRGRTRNDMRNNKREYLSLQLGFHDIDMDVLPVGMSKYKLNQSRWDSKKKIAFLTIEFIFHPPVHILANVNPQPYTLLTHSNPLDRTLRQCIHTHLKERSEVKKNGSLCDWLYSLTGIDSDDTESEAPLCVMKHRGSPEHALHKSSSSNSTGKGDLYHSLDWNKKLATVLQHKHFAEFPTVEVMDKVNFVGVLVDEIGSEQEFVDRRKKRRKLDSAAGKKAIAGLLQSYGSDDDDDDDDDGDDDEENTNTLAALCDYNDSGSDDNEDPLSSNESSGSDKSVAENGENLEEELPDIMVDGEVDLGNDASSLVGDIDVANEELDTSDEEEVAADEAKLAALLEAVQKRNKVTV